MGSTQFAGNGGDELSVNVSNTQVNEGQVSGSGTNLVTPTEENVGKSSPSTALGSEYFTRQYTVDMNTTKGPDVQFAGDVGKQ